MLFTFISSRAGFSVKGTLPFRQYCISCERTGVLFDGEQRVLPEDLVDTSVKMDIQGYDIDPLIVKAARENAGRASVAELIHFQQRPIHKLRHPKKYGFVITNPPYGERMEEKEDMPILYREIGEAFSHLDDWSEYIITAY